MPPAASYSTKLAAFSYPHRAVSRRGAPPTWSKLEEAVFSFNDASRALGWAVKRETGRLCGAGETGGRQDAKLGVSPGWQRERERKDPDKERAQPSIGHLG